MWECVREAWRKEVSWARSVQHLCKIDTGLYRLLAVLLVLHLPCSRTTKSKLMLAEPSPFSRKRVHTSTRHLQCAVKNRVGTSGTHARVSYNTTQTPFSTTHLQPTSLHPTPSTIPTTPTTPTTTTTTLTSPQSVRKVARRGRVYTRIRTPSFPCGRLFGPPTRIHRTAGLNSVSNGVGGGVGGGIGGGWRSTVASRIIGYCRLINISSHLAERTTT